MFTEELAPLKLRLGITTFVETAEFELLTCPPSRMSNIPGSRDGRPIERLMISIPIGLLA